MDPTTVERSHKQRVDEFPFRYVVNVGGSDHPVMESIRLNVRGPVTAHPWDTATAWMPAARSTSTETHGRDEPRGLVTHTISRAPSGFGSSAGAANTTILTDGVVGVPGTGGIPHRWGQCWTSGQNVDLLVDRGAPQAVAAFRANRSAMPRGTR